MKNAIIAQAIRMLETSVYENCVVSDPIKTPEAIMDLLRLRLANKKVEEIGVVFLNQANKVISITKLEEGIENRAHVYVKKLFKLAFDKHATGMILYHNHPTGRVDFSPQDITLTKQVMTAGDILEIRLLDHILVAHSQGVSMRETIGMPS